VIVVVTVTAANVMAATMIVAVVVAITMASAWLVAVGIGKALRSVGGMIGCRR
jgi:hypothetical protein